MLIQCMFGVCGTFREEGQGGLLEEMTSTFWIKVAAVKMEKNRQNQGVANGLDMCKWKHAFGCEGEGIRETQGF